MQEPVARTVIPAHEALLITMQAEGRSHRPLKTPVEHRRTAIMIVYPRQVHAIHPRTALQRQDSVVKLKSYPIMKSESQKRPVIYHVGTVAPAMRIDLDELVVVFLRGADDWALTTLLGG